MRLLVLGAGMMGSAAASDMAGSKNVEKVILADAELRRAKQAAAGHPRIETREVDVTNPDHVRAAMKGVDGVLSAVPYFYNLNLTRAAIDAGVHFCDLGGNSRLVEQQFALDEEARDSGVRVLPDCGLSPGMTSILAADGMRRVQDADSIHIRVGGLPLKPQPPLNYKLLFSAHGLINEYIEPARIIRRGQAVEIDSMTGLETIRFPGFPALEAFYTSGGASTLPETYAGRLRELDEKTIRYPGHCEAFRLLFWLGFGEGGRRQVLTKAIEEKLQLPGGDVLLLRVDVLGKRGGVRYQLVERGTEKLTAMMKTTAWPASILLQMLVDGRVHQTGVLKLEEAVPPEEFVAEMGRRRIRIRPTRVRGNARGNAGEARRKTATARE